MFVRYLECPQSLIPASAPGVSVFLGGGISNCPDWQQQFREIVSKKVAALPPKTVPCSLILVNPRRSVSFDVGDASLTAEQIKWERHHLQLCDAIIFWFPSESLCPITLYELGTWSAHSGKELFVGTHDQYSKKLDVVVQTQLARPEIQVVHTLDALAEQLLRRLPVLHSSNQEGEPAVTEKDELEQELRRPGGHMEQWFRAKYIADERLALTETDSNKPRVWVAASSSGCCCAAPTRREAVETLEKLNVDGGVTYVADRVEPIRKVRS